MTSHKNTRTTVHQRKRIRHSRASDLVQALALGGTVAAVSKWRRHADPQGHAGRSQHQDKALPSEAEPLLGWLRKDWLALRHIASHNSVAQPSHGNLVRGCSCLGSGCCCRTRLVRKGASAPVPWGSSISIPLPLRLGDHGGTCL